MMEWTDEKIMKFWNYESQFSENYFKLVNPITVIDHNGPQKAYEDMGIMSLCKHHIIANSSFSWWGAWLCKNPNKIVVSPSGWFNDKSLNTNDFIPDGWIRI